jgi:hypothetical protein
MFDVGELVREIQQSRTIQKSECFTVLELEFMVDDVCGGSGDVGDDCPELSDETVEEGGFSDVGSSD